MIAVERYLRRIGIDPQTGPPTLDLLAHLQLAHLVHVPFENLDVYHRRGTRTDAEWSYLKIVERGRGGWCFELNGAFATLLRGLGFDADHVSCQVWSADNATWGPPFDHLGTVVRLDGTQWFVDVGFGDACLEPLAITADERAAAPRRVRTEVEHADGADHLLVTEQLTDGSGTWEPQLRARIEPCALEQFTPRSIHLQTYPGLSWQEKPFATRAIDATGSRITLRSAVLRRRGGTGEFEDSEVTADEWSAVLLEHFGLADRLDR